MKKSIVFSAIGIITGILFSSCGSNLSIMKRRYNDGYYVSHGSGKQKTAVPKEERKIPFETKRPSPAAQSQARKKTTARHTKQNTATAGKTVTTDNTGMKTQKRPQLNPGQSRETSVKPVAEVKRILSETKKTKSGSTEREALSLFWIIILVVLIIWAAGLLAGGLGAGGLINVLLVIALILVILWLLRIV
ncbi:MAG: hypothetical protein FD123_4133 [Bacteroidetes bacterium]|nr:MAG: hypothetical protein FD123_4133 [Bacteroidota bacterium]